MDAVRTGSHSIQADFSQRAGILRPVNAKLVFAHYVHTITSSHIIFYIEALVYIEQTPNIEYVQFFDFGLN